MKHHSAPLHFATLAFTVLLFTLDLNADTCVKYHKRAPVKAVCGRVINFAGEKLGNVKFSLTDDQGSVLYTATSDGRGDFRFASVKKGQYTLRATAPGWMDVQREILVTHDNRRRCYSKINVTLGVSVCTTGTYVKGVDKPSDLDAELRGRR